MTLILLHTIQDATVLINTDALNAAVRRYPDEGSMMKEPFTKLYFTHKEKGMESLGYPDAVKESPEEIWDLMRK